MARDAQLSFATPFLIRNVTGPIFCPLKIIKSPPAQRITSPYRFGESRNKSQNAFWAKKGAFYTPLWINICK
jgi:hypothetical protein